MAGIFISYRRSESSTYVGRLFDELSEHYGRENVFVDLATIEPGRDFVEEVRRAVESSAVMLVIIGPHWLDSEGASRLSNPDDFIRLEIASALQSGKRIIPVLVEGVSMPAAQSLPAELVGLTRRQAFILSSTSWRADVERLKAYLDATLRHDSRPHPGVASWLQRLWWWLLERLKSVEEERAATAAAAAPPPAGRLEAPAPRHEVFVSHAGEDRALVESVVAALERSGHRCWVSYRDIPFGEPSWAGAIVGAIATSKLVVVVVSRHSNSSKQVLREVTLADDEDIPFLAFRVDDSPLSNDFKFFFSAPQRLDAAQLSRTEALSLLTSAVGQFASAAARATDGHGDLSA